VARTIETGVDLDLACRGVRADGLVYWTLMKGRVQRDQAGVPTQLVGVALDITERKAVEQALVESERSHSRLAEARQQLLVREQAAREAAEEASRLHRDVEERLALLVDASDALLGSVKSEELPPAVLGLARVLISADAYAVWRLVDPAAGRWRIASAAGLSERFCTDSVLVNPGEWPPMDVPFVAEDVPKTVELAARHEELGREGIRSLLTVPLRVRGQRWGNIVFYYRTLHRFAESEPRVALALANLAGAALGNLEFYEEQRRLRREAERANRTKDEFLATLSHELRTPLNAIAGWVNLITKGALEPEAIKHALEVIARNTRAQAHIIDELLDVSRIITGKLRLDLKPLELAPVIRAAADAMRPAAEAKEIALELRLEAAGAAVLGDSDRLQQVVWNLISNAIKFTDRGGSVVVLLARRAGEVELTVADTGRGIAPEFLPHVFDRFAQADPTISPKQGGLGLGLAIVRHLVELHGGTVAADSPGVGLGATFRLRLPAKGWDADSVSDAPAEATAGKPGLSARA
jgi:signal transduction histidine kinase